MLDPAQALAAARRATKPPAAPLRPRRVLVVGGAGALGAEVLEQLLGGHRFEQVGVLAHPALQPAIRGLRPVGDDAASLARYAADTALVVFDRERHANGRDAAFVRDEPAQLPQRAAALHAAGVRTLIVVVPHAPALLPQALMAGLATLDEATVAAIGFSHLVFMRTAQAGPAASAGRALAAPERLAQWMLSQLRWMIPQQEQPVRAATVARVAAALAQALPDAPAGTRVLPPTLLWLAAATPDRGALDALVDDWLAGRALRASAARARGQRPPGHR